MVQKRVGQKVILQVIQRVVSSHLPVNEMKMAVHICTEPFRCIIGSTTAAIITISDHTRNSRGSVQM